MTALSGELRYVRNADYDHPAARAVRAARAYAHMSRKQLGDEVGVVAGTIGRYERGDWREGPPRISLLEGIARATKINELVDDLLATSAEKDPARRFAAVARQEAQRRNGHRGSGSTAPPDEDAEGGVR